MKKTTLEINGNIYCGETDDKFFYFNAVDSVEMGDKIKLASAEPKELSGAKKEIIAGNMAEFTIHANRVNDDEMNVSLTIHDGHIVAQSKNVKVNDDTLYEQLFEYCRQAIEKNL